jgi:uncharacterized damage-inducible protein DinB
LANQQTIAMKTFVKRNLLDALHLTVDSHLQATIQTFQNLTVDQLLKQPVSGGWSAAQCFEHLNQYGHYYLPQIHKSLEGNTSLNSGDTFKSTWLGSYFTKMMDPDTGKKKIKTFKEYVPKSELDAHAVIAEFIRQQETMLKYLHEAQSADLNRRIPISLTKLIRLKLGDVFQFVIAHNARHVAQAKRAL